MPRFIQASVLWHVLALGWVVLQPSMWPWALAGLVVNHALISAAGLWPRSQCLGPNITRLGAGAQERRQVALTIDDGPDPQVTPAVLDALSVWGIRATFFCIAERALQHPQLVRDMVARGHSVQNHSFKHPHAFSFYGPRRMRREVAQAQAALADLTGLRPTCFRPPAGLRNPFLDPVLHRLGMHLVTWTRRGYDTRDTDASKVLQRLADGLAPGDILLVHDGHAARTPQGTPLILEVLPVLARRASAMNLSWVTLPEAIPDPCTGRTT